MKIAYQNKNCWKLQAGNWEDCEGCAFHMDTFGKWPCDLIPKMRCVGLDLYVQTDELEEIFRV